MNGKADHCQILTKLSPAAGQRWLGKFRQRGKWIVGLIAAKGLRYRKHDE